MADTVLQRRNSHVPRTENIVADGLVGVHFEKTDVFVRRRVKNDFRLLFLENFVNQSAHGRVCQKRLNLQHRESLVQFAMNVEQAILGLLEQEQYTWRSSCNLA